MHWEHNRRRYWESHLIERGQYPGQEISNFEKLWHASSFAAVGLTGAATFLSQGMTGKRLRGSDVPIVTPNKPERISYNRQENGDPYAGGGPVELMPGDVVEMGGVPGGGPVPVKKNDKRKVTRGTFSSPMAVKVVGNPDLSMEQERAFLGSTSGWKVIGKNYRRDAAWFSPLTLFVGDCLSTKTVSAAGPPVVDGTEKPTWVVSGGIASLTSELNRCYCSDDVTVAKKAGTAWATLGVAGKVTHRYADFCVPICPLASLGTVDFNAGGTTQYVSNTPIGVLDLFSTVTDGSSRNLVQLAGEPFTLPAGAADTAVSGGSASYPYQSCYITLETEFKIHNDRDTTQTYEIYHLRPKAVTKNSPILDLQVSHREGYCPQANYGLDSYQFAYLNPGRNPWFYKHFRERWGIIKRRVYQVCPGNTITVKVRVPLSYIQKMTVNKILDGESFVSAPGLTSWFWIRATGVESMDFANAEIATDIGQFAITMHQKLRIMASREHVNKRIDLRSFGSYEDGSSTFYEKMAQDDAQS